MGILPCRSRDIRDAQPDLFDDRGLSVMVKMKTAQTGDPVFDMLCDENLKGSGLPYLANPSSIDFI